MLSLVLLYHAQQIGAYHTLDLELNQVFSIEKDIWDVIHLERIETSSDPSKKVRRCMNVNQALSSSVDPRTPPPVLEVKEYMGSETSLFRVEWNNHVAYVTVLMSWKQACPSCRSAFFHPLACTGGSDPTIIF